MMLHNLCFKSICRFGLVCGLALLIVAPPLDVSAQDAPLSLRLMSSQSASLSEDEAETLWDYSPGESVSTLLVSVIEGALDPLIEVLDEDGNIVGLNDDYAPQFSPDARLVVPAGGPYQLRVAAVSGAGTYEITALPGEMQRQWADDFSLDDPSWRITGAIAGAGGLGLETPLGDQRFFEPNGAPRAADLYLQARLSWRTNRPQSEMGLSLRNQTTSGGLLTGYRLVVAPSGAWRLYQIDLIGTETDLLRGDLALSEGSLWLGLLAQGDTLAAYADGALLGQINMAELASQNRWGLYLYDGSIYVDDFWLGLPLTTPPDFPEQITAWQSSQPNDIAAELSANGLIPNNGARRFIVPTTDYTVGANEQRNFLVTDASDVYDNFVMGGDVRFTSGVDIGCGLMSGFQDRNNKLIGFVDNQNGAGLFWWDNGQIAHSNYIILDDLGGADPRLLLLRHDQYTAFYVNGQLSALSIIPRRTGNVGVGFLNYGAGVASCLFRNIWLWS